MVIDLTRKPVVVNTDICQNWVVVRTASNSDVDGRLRRKLEKREFRRGRGEKHVGNEMAEVEVGASLQRPGKMVLETRLPLDHILRRKDDEPLTNPYEVATLYTDGFTNKQSIWRAQILVEHVKNKNGGIWLVTIRDDGAKIDLLTATAKELETSSPVLIMKGVPNSEDRFPLDRIKGGAKESAGPLNVWERIRRTSYHPAGLDDDEEP